MPLPAIITAGRATSQEALALFDSLPAVSVNFMLGNWTGSGLHTDHPMDGLLEAYHWHGKRFESPEEVHPLVFKTVSGATRSINPGLMGSVLNLAASTPMPKSPLIGRSFQLLTPLMRTSKSRARLRMVDYRGKSSATMVYDQLPINDTFRKVDEHTVLGLMDLKGMQQPFFFILRRET